jgi:hypothetical protein
MTQTQTNGNFGTLLEVGAMAVALGLSAQAAKGPVATETQKQTQTLNEATLVSIEESWLQVPAPCKSRGFNADAKSVIESATPAAVVEIFRA